VVEKSFFEQVYALVATIPAGKVMTYGQIGRVLDSPYSAKIVGFAMSMAPEGRGLPCHRVINRLGAMAGGALFGGEENQRSMLQQEGVPFLENGRVDLRKARFEPEA
jgi:methylated-DNA-protein-cysteine methyltransferase-like protein